MSDDILAALNPAGADLVLKSSDGHRFPVHKAIVCYASLTLKEFPFDVSHHAEDTDAGIPIVPFLESAQTIENLLRLIYPISPPIFHTLFEVHAVLEIGRKYQVDVVPVRVGQILLADGTFIEKQPVGVFALARGYGMPTVALRAARSVLLLEDLDEIEPHVLASISAEEYYWLSRYRRDCIRATEAAFTESALCTLLENHKGWTWVSCTQRDEVCETSGVSISNVSHRPYNMAYVREWWWMYIEDLRTALRSRATSAILDDPGIIARAGTLAAQCPTCSTEIAADLAHFVRVMKVDIEPIFS